jgi:hypothetical protein
VFRYRIRLSIFDCSSDVSDSSLNSLRISRTKVLRESASAARLESDLPNNGQTFNLEDLGAFRLLGCI